MERKFIYFGFLVFVIHSDFWFLVSGFSSLEAAETIMHPIPNDQYSKESSHPIACNAIITSPCIAPMMTVAINASCKSTSNNAANEVK